MVQNLMDLVVVFEPLEIGKAGTFWSVKGKFGVDQGGVGKKRTEHDECK